MQKGANEFLVNDEGESIIHSIVYSGISERLNILLKNRLEAISLIDAQTNEGVTPLLLAVTLNDYSMCRHLINLGADVNVADETNSSPYIRRVLWDMGIL